MTQDNLFVTSSLTAARNKADQQETPSAKTYKPAQRHAGTLLEQNRWSNREVDYMSQGALVRRDERWSRTDLVSPSDPLYVAETDGSTPAHKLNKPISEQKPKTRTDPDPDCYTICPEPQPRGMLGHY